MDRPKRKENFKLEEVGGEILLYHPETAKILYCNETAKLIWQLCDGSRTEDEIAGIFREAFPEEGDAVADDVKETLKQFLDHGAVELA
jgi:hypothetical protein